MNNLTSNQEMLRQPAKIDELSTMSLEDLISTQGAALASASLRFKEKSQRIQIDAVEVLKYQTLITNAHMAKNKNELVRSILGLRKFGD